VQEAFVRLWREPPEVGEVAYAAWLRRVVTNLSINCLKRTRRPGELQEFSTDRALRTREPAPPEQSALWDETSRVELAMQGIDEHKRAILMLRGVERLSYEAIAEHLGIPVGTVMSRLNRARAALMDEMDRLESAPAAEAADASFDIRRYRRA
jgi:RNA polymerase sigma-70 factor (ECF subfamily)